MKLSTTPKNKANGLPVLSSRAKGWENIVVEQFCHPPGEGGGYHSDEHTVCLSLVNRPIRASQIRENKTYSGLYTKGDISITPAEIPFFAQWDSDNHLLKIRLTSRFIQQVARESLEMRSDRVEFLSIAQIRDPQIEAIGWLLLTELKQEQAGSKLYIESLANVLAVHLIRQYGTARPQPVLYEGGLAQRQLLQVLDYIDAHLHQEIKLTDLATLLGMSQFHFSHQFKQSMGISPYQYLLQHRFPRRDRKVAGSAEKLPTHCVQDLMADVP